MSSHNCNTDLIINNNIYLNEDTNLYQILEEIGIDDDNKLRILYQILNHDNKLGLFLIDPIKTYIKKNRLIVSNQESIKIKKNQFGYFEVDGTDLEKICSHMVSSLITGLRKNGIVQ